MRFFSFYRLYSALIIGALFYFLTVRSLWYAAGIAIVMRIVWYLIEKFVMKRKIAAWFEAHQGPFKELFGPYGIRIINKAQADPAIKATLAEVFTPNLNELQRNVETLEAMDVIFKAGMQPDSDTWQVHDLKLKYGKFRLEKTGKKSAVE
jgi:hypothetical protein